MKISLFTACVTAFSLVASAQTTYTGNGGESFGGVLGPSTLVLSDDGTTVDFALTKGNGALNDVIVFYIDSEAGGYGSTANFVDYSDGGRTAVSGAGMNARSTVTFPAGFTADYAIAVGIGGDNDGDGVRDLFASLYDLVADGEPGGQFSGGTTNEPGAFFFLTSGGAAANGNDITFSFDFGALGTTPAQGFNFVATYVNNSSGYRSNEAIGASDAPAGDQQIGNSEFQEASGGNLTFTGALTYSANMSLPVSLARFSATAVRGAVTLDWATASETDNAGFAVERSADATAWTEIGFVAGAGDTDAMQTYGFRDGDALAGIHYYRLKQVDFDGQATYSAVVSARAARADGGFAIAIEGAHPLRGATVLRNTGAEDLDVALYDLTGRTVRAFRIDATAAYTLDADALASGTYLLRAGRSTRRVIVR